MSSEIINFTPQSGQTQIPSLQYAKTSAFITLLPLRTSGAELAAFLPTAIGDLPPLHRN
jgi:hypothetical protein